MLALYTYWRSSAAYRVRIALALKGLEYESRFVHLLKGEQTSGDYLALNPQGRVPTLVHDGRAITQSLAIIEYLDERFPEPALLPADAAGRARVRSLSQLIASEIQPMQNLSTTQYLETVLGCDARQVEAWRADWVERGMRALERRLASERETGEFMHGSAPSMADCCLAPQCYAARRFGVDIARYPTIARIEAACAQHEAFRRAAPEQQGDRA